MKTRILFFLLIFETICFHAYSKTFDEYLARIRNAVPSKTLKSEDRWILEYGDFVGDGRDVMLAFVYEETSRDDEFEYGNYYLVYSTEKKVSVCDTLYGSFYKLPEIYVAGKSAIIFYTIGSGGPSGESFCWRFCKDSLAAVRMPGELELIGDNHFRCTKSGFDSFKANEAYESFSPGRCFYNYYYFFDGIQFREYGGKELPEYQFVSLQEGTELLQQLRSEGYTVENIYYRSNGIININCSYRTKKSTWDENILLEGTGFAYMELKVTETGLDLGEGLMPGQIKAAYTPECAVWP